MRITLGAIREILEDYNKEKNRTLVIPNELVHDIKQEFEETKDSDLTVEDLVIEIYEELLCDCEHDDYCVEDDEYCSGVDIHGDPQYRETRYKVCNVCGATCPILGVERTGEGDYDEICGDWEYE